MCCILEAARGAITNYSSKWHFVGSVWGLRSTTVNAQQYELNWPYCSDWSLWGKSQPNTTVSELITALKRYCSTDWLIGRDAGRHYLSCRQLPPAARHVRCWQTLTFSQRVERDRRRGSDGHYLALITVMRKGHRAAVTDTKPRWRLTLDINLQNPSCWIMSHCLTDRQSGNYLCKSLQTNS